jgi:hypothetical protein
LRVLAGFSRSESTEIAHTMHCNDFRGTKIVRTV